MGNLARAGSDAQFRCIEAALCGGLLTENSFALAAGKSALRSEMQRHSLMGNLACAGSAPKD